MHLTLVAEILEELAQVLPLAAASTLEPGSTWVTLALDYTWSLLFVDSYFSQHLWYFYPSRGDRRNHWAMRYCFWAFSIWSLSHIRTGFGHSKLVLPSAEMIEGQAKTYQPSNRWGRELSHPGLLLGNMGLCSIVEHERSSGQMGHPSELEEQYWIEMERQILESSIEELTRRMDLLSTVAHQFEIGSGWSPFMAVHRRRIDLGLAGWFGIGLASVINWSEIDSSGLHLEPIVSISALIWLTCHLCSQNLVFQPLWYLVHVNGLHSHPWQGWVLLPSCQRGLHFLASQVILLFANPGHRCT